MPITTKSAFTYGHTITNDNSDINFSENFIDELTASIDIGSYYLNNFGDKIAQALNDIGDNTYTVTLDRSTRKYTISADANFDLYVTTGSNLATSAFSLIGFTTDRSGSDSYEADIASGSIYFPQTNLRDFVDFTDIEESVNANVNESSDGSTIEVVSIGERNFMECNIKYATDITGQAYIEDNLTGVADLRTFMQYLITKAPVEFIKDRSDLDTFESCIVERTARSSDGIGFELRELYAEGLAYYFETGKLTFRRI